MFFSAFLLVFQVAGGEGRGGGAQKRPEVSVVRLNRVALFGLASIVQVDTTLCCVEQRRGDMMEAKKKAACSNFRFWVNVIGKSDKTVNMHKLIETAHN